VCGFECFRHLDSVLDDFLIREWTIAEPITQRLSFKKFHHHEGLTFSFAHVMNGANIRMGAGHSCGSGGGPS
jgi:hypothetical protein